ncbi:MAG TPA: PQQ-binding-like beta-propeller repeat protein [Bryobacteraceae bacterium]|jgi:quinoprotein glucose dehydrogenase
MRLLPTLLLASAIPAFAQIKPTPPGDWPMYNRDLTSSRYSPLTQIATKNVASLARAWTFTARGETPTANSGKQKGKGGAGGIGSEATPIAISGVLYVPAGPLVIALDGATGREVWRYRVPMGQASSRGVAYWPGDAQNPPRNVFTAGRNLIALNAKTGDLDPGFGKEGIVDMTIGYGGVPTIFKNVVLVGASVLEAEIGPPGDTRAFDARTGAKLWEFHTVPRPGEVGHETWLNDGWKDRSGTNIWAFAMSGDEQRGLLYMPIDGPASNYYGGDRPGANLFGNSIVAVDVQTGKYKWHFQTVHHDLWDFDNPPAPTLLEITQKGKRIPVLAQIGKTGWMFILNRETGKPVFGVEERPVAKGDVPGEWYSPTQPFPVKPGPLARMSYKPEDLVTAEDTTPEHAKACQDLVERSGGFYNAGPFTPFLFHEEGAPPKSNIIFPGATGGTDWGGMANDPKLGYVFAYTQDRGQVGWVEKKKPAVVYSPDERDSKLLYTRASVDGPGPFHTFTAPAGAGLGELPCQKPPWGRLNAVNAATGEIAWQVPLGVTDGLPPGKQNTGRAGGFAGPTATAGGLVFIGSVNDGRFRAHDSKTGKELWVTKLGTQAATANPMTYLGKNGKQYVAIAAGGTLEVFALP